MKEQANVDLQSNSSNYIKLNAQILECWKMKKNWNRRGKRKEWEERINA